MIASVFRGPDGFYVLYTVDGVDVDEAGPFPDEIDAVEAATRAVPETIWFVHGNGAA